MDDFSSQMLFQQCNKVQKSVLRNVDDYYYYQQSSCNTRSNASVRNNQQIFFEKNKKRMRHSVDNLLEIDTSYYNNIHQVRLEYLSS